MGKDGHNLSEYRSTEKDKILNLEILVCPAFF